MLSLEDPTLKGDLQGTIRVSRSGSPSCELHLLLGSIRESTRVFGRQREKTEERPFTVVKLKTPPQHPVVSMLIHPMAVQIDPHPTRYLEDPWVLPSPPLAEDQLVRVGVGYTVKEWCTSASDNGALH